jgi:hypothetical protein
MRVTVVVVAALLAAACSSSSSGTRPPTSSGGVGGTGGSSGTGGSGGSGGGGSGGAGGGETPIPALDAAPPGSVGPIAADAALDQASTPVTGGDAGGTVLYIAGEKPTVGTDAQIHEALKTRGLQIQDVRETTVTPAQAQGKRLIIVSYSIQSTSFKAEDWADVTVPILVLEHFTLPRLGMTTMNGFQVGLTSLTIISNDPILTGGLPMGDVSPYTAQGKEMFWGVPGPGAIKVATAKGNAGRFVYFAYPAGAMMASKPAPAKRMLFFAASHAPPPVTDQLLNPDGVKLLGGAIDWMIK